MRTIIVLSVALMSAISSLSQQQKPNVILILADDLGWADLRCYGSAFYETPHLDKLAAQGARFTRAYATAPVCSPTRASIMTGKYPVKTGVTDWIPGRQVNNKAWPYEKMLARPTAFQLALEEETLAEIALKNGYQTFHAGKWHLGDEDKYWPQAQGWQYNIGGWGKGHPTGKTSDSTGGHFTPYSNPTIVDGPPGEYLTDRLANECISFLEKRSSAPFLLMYSMYTPHIPMQAPKELIRKYEAKQKRLGLSDQQRFRKDEPWMKNEEIWKQRIVQDDPVYAAMIENMDANVGRILDALKRLDLDRNTIVIFTSDNGGVSTADGSPTFNNELRAGKGWLYEGGIRVPLLIRWNGKVKPETTSDVPVTSADLFTTLVGAMHPSYRTASDIDGQNILSLMARASSSGQRSLYWHYPHYSFQGGHPASAIMKGDYKLIYFHESREVELYNIRLDVSERHDLSKTDSRTAQEMNRELQKWLKETGATFPDANPGYAGD